MARRPKVLEAFTPDEADLAHRALAGRVATMEGRKLEEGDWSYVYCTAKGIPQVGWSNLELDVSYGNVGVEHKMLRKVTSDVLEVAGTTLMHPSLTRRIRVSDGDPNSVMAEVFNQYAENVEGAKRQLSRASGNRDIELRTGWLIWTPGLVEFLYFEEEILTPNPNEYQAEWHINSVQGGRRRASRSLWVYDRESGTKRYSITTDAGAKIQPYFDVPGSGTKGLYYFKVQGEEIHNGVTRIWVTPQTLRELQRTCGGEVSRERFESLLDAAIKQSSAVSLIPSIGSQEAVPLEISTGSYSRMKSNFESVSDEHAIRLVIQSLS